MSETKAPDLLTRFLKKRAFKKEHPVGSALADVRDRWDALKVARTMRVSGISAAAAEAALNKVTIDRLFAVLDAQFDLAEALIGERNELVEKLGEAEEAEEGLERIRDLFHERRHEPGMEAIIRQVEDAIGDEA